MRRRSLLIATGACAAASCLPLRRAASRPLVIAHRGASGYRPEHTLAAYQLAIEQGADFIECDLVPTRDGVLVSRHENELSLSTDVAARPVFADRLTSKRVDGMEVRGWFAEDFTLDEIKSPRCVETQPAVRPANRRFDGQFPILTFDEVIQLAKAGDVGLYAETKHPSYFEHLGLRLDGQPIATPVTRLLLDRLQAAAFTDPSRVYIQSFELSNLLRCARQKWPARGLRLPLVLLLGDLAIDAPPRGFAAPFDWSDENPERNQLAESEAELARLTGRSGALRYADLVAPAVLQWLAAEGIDGVGPWKESLLLREPLAPPQDRNADGRAELAWRRTGAVHPVAAHARASGLQVHAYTLRAEERFLALPIAGEPTMEHEMEALLALGCDGWFTDFPDRGVVVRERTQTIVVDG
jgi:glycerophosphoryl diester phosphodiesterase